MRSRSVMRLRIVTGAGTVILAFLLVTNPVVVEAARQVTGADIADGTIQRRDLAPRTWNALQDQHSYRFRLPAQEPAQEMAYSLTGLPPGNYVFVYSVLAVEDSPSSLQCSLTQSAGSQREEGFNYATNVGTYLSVVGGGAIRVRSEPPRFHCLTASDTFEIYDDAVRPSTITLTRVDSMSTSLARVAPAG